MLHPTDARTNAVSVRRVTGRLAPSLLALGLVASLPTSLLLAASDTPLSDLVFVTDDMTRYDPGCEAISIFDSSNGTDIVRGGFHPSPGRLTVTPDGKLVVAMSINNGPFVYLLTRTPTDGATWRTFRVNLTRGLQAGQPAISPNGEILLLPMLNGDATPGGTNGTS